MALAPLPPGMTRSIRTTSGWWLAATSTASGPLAASPTTSMSGWSCRKARRPWRTTAWSSTRRTRIREPGSRGTGRRPQGNRGGHGGALARRRLHLELAADRTGPLTHRRQAHRARGARERPGVEAGTVVAHRQPHVVVVLLEPDLNPGAGGVAERVVEGLLGDPEERQLGGRCQLRLAPSNPDLDGGAVRPLERVHVVAEGRLEAVPFQALRTQRVDEGPHLLQGRRRASLQPAQ